MGRLRHFRPNPALVIAILALVAAVAGTAVADPIATTSKPLSRKTVNKIVDRAIAAKAPGLSVAHAGSADTLGGQSASELSVAHAGSADTLGGKSASQLQTTSAYAQREADLNMTGNFQAVVSTSVESAGGRVIASASLQVDGHTDNADDDITCLIQIAGVNGLSHTQATPDTVAGVSESATISLAFATTLGAGTHPVSLQCGGENGNVSVDEAELSVIGAS